MDNRLFEAARVGNIQILSQLLQENPLILSEISLLSPTENPLHVAAKAGQLVFVCEIIKEKPELAHELNKHGFRPLDIAAACGHVDIVKALIATGVQRMKGREGRTALHYAALKGRVEVIDELVSACLECVKDVTIVGETALHVAAKYYQIEALRRLIEWVGVENNGLEEVLNWSDRDGNTVLHLAVSGGQLETVELLLGSRIHTTSKLLQLNATNSKGLTAMDLLDVLTESPNNTDIQPKLIEILRSAGALRAKDITNVSLSPAHTPEPEPSEGHPSNDWSTYFKFQLDRDMRGETRNALLVVAALIVTATFQAVFSPPSFPTLLNLINSGATSNYEILCAVLVRKAFFNVNTLGFYSSIVIIEYLTKGFPIHRELHMALYSLMAAYAIVAFPIFGNNMGLDWMDIMEIIWTICVLIFVLWSTYFKFQLDRDMRGVTRNALLVVAAIVALPFFGNLSLYCLNYFNLWGFRRSLGLC